MMEIEGTITTRTTRAGCIAASLKPDNLRSMTTIGRRRPRDHADHGHPAPVGHRIR